MNETLFLGKLLTNNTFNWFTSITYTYCLAPDCMWLPVYLPTCHSSLLPIFPVISQLSRSSILPIFLFVTRFYLWFTGSRLLGCIIVLVWLAGCFGWVALWQLNNLQLDTIWKAYFLYISYHCFYWTQTAAIHALVYSVRENNPTFHIMSRCVHWTQKILKKLISSASHRNLQC